MLKIRFDQSRTTAHTHSVEDGVIRYYTPAPGATPREIATAFLAGYYQAGAPEPMPVTFRVERLVPGEYRGELLAEYRGLPDGKPERIS